MDEWIDEYMIGNGIRWHIELIQLGVISKQTSHWVECKFTSPWMGSGFFHFLQSLVTTTWDLASQEKQLCRREILELDAGCARKVNLTHLPHNETQVHSATDFHCCLSNKITAPTGDCLTHKATQYYNHLYEVSSTYII